VLRGAGFNFQFEGDWKAVNISKDDRLVGRAVTAVFVPMRPDLNDYINENAKREGRVGRGQNSWPIDMLKPGDVLVVELVGKVADVSEETQLRDEWGHMMLREGKYTPGQIDSRWTEQMQAEYQKWAAEQRAKRRP
jgi:hypothetical protein